MDDDTRQQAGSIGHDMALTTFGVTSPSSLILRTSDFRADVVSRQMCLPTSSSADACLALRSGFHGKHPAEAAD